jgi:predicted dehydrogenase
MVNAARHYNRVVQIGAQGRSNPNARAACQYIRNGMIGKVSRVEIFHPDNPTTSDYADDRPVPPNLDWDLWLGPARWRAYHPQYHPGSFRWFMDLGGGQIRDRGNHALSMVCWLMNHDDYRGLVTVESTGDAQPEGMYDTPKNLVVNWTFRNPDWTLTWRQGEVPKTHGLWGATYHGDKDTLIVTQGDNACNTEDKAKQYVPPSSGEVYLHPTDPALSATQRHQQNWYDCIKSGNRPAMDVELGHHSVSLCILGNMAYQLGRKLTYNMGRERFVNDPEADRMIHRPYRAGWHL